MSANYVVYFRSNGLP